MNLWTGLAIGLLGGWLIEWAIDWLYWRSRFAAEATALCEHNKHLSLDFNVATAAQQRAEAQITSLKASLALAHANNDLLRASLATAAGSARQHQAEINKLRTELDCITIEHKRLQSGLSTVQASAHQFQAYTRTLEANHRLSPALNNTLAATDANPSTEAEHIQVGTIFDRDRLIMLPDALNIAPQRPAANRCDPLIDINGIGVLYEQKLFDAGVLTFDDLASLSPERVQAIINPQPWQTIDAESWISEARQRVQPS